MVLRDTEHLTAACSMTIIGVPLKGPIAEDTPCEMVLTGGITGLTMEFHQMDGEWSERSTVEEGGEPTTEPTSEPTSEPTTEEEGGESTKLEDGSDSEENPDPETGGSSPFAFCTCLVLSFLL
eukprot:Trichotokara_eunicae@DN6320_c0_g1_i1.p1